MVSIGRTGRATPFAVLEPVFVGGSTVAMATLHNQDEVARKDVRVGDTVIVRKAGDVIPEVVGPVLAKRKRGARKWKFPTDCPVCAPAARAPRGGGRHALRERRLPRAARAADRLLRRPVGHGHRGARRGAGPQFVDAGLLSDAGDVYRLTVEQLVPLERMGETVGAAAGRGDRRVADAARSAQLLVGLGIRHVGPSRGDRARPRARQPRRDRVGVGRGRSRSSTGVGGVIAESVQRLLRRRAQPRARREAARRGGELRRARARRARRVDGPSLAGLTFVLTGTLPGIDPRGGAGRDRGARRQGHRQRLEEDELRRRGREPGLEARQGGATRRRRSSTSPNFVSCSSTA